MVGDVVSRSCKNCSFVSLYVPVGLGMIYGRCKLLDLQLFAEVHVELPYKLLALIGLHVALYGEWYDPVIEEDVRYLRGAFLGCWYCSRYPGVPVGHHDYELIILRGSQKRSQNIRS